MKVFLNSLIGQLLMTPYIFYRGYQVIPAKQAYRIPYILFFIIELLLYFTGFFFHNQLPDAVMIDILYFCGTWYIASIYITLSLVMLELVRLSNRYKPWYPPFIKTHWQQTKLFLFIVIVVGVSGLMVKGYHNATNTIVTHVDLKLPKGSSTRDSLKIVMMADLHIGEEIGKKRVQQFVALSNAQHPDMVVLVGDLIDYESRFAEHMKAEEDLQQLKAPLGTYIVYGNHEYRANRFAKTRWIRKTGGILLVDSVAMPDSTFYLIGRDDLINRARKPLHAIMEGIDTTKPTIVLDHQPWSFAEMAMNGVDLGLHGHTHNGQVWPSPLLMKLVYDQPYGYFKKGNTQYYVTSGIGFSGPPYRIGTVSELVVLHITFTEE